MTHDTTPPTELLNEVPQPLHSIVENFWHDWCVACEKKEINPKQNLPLSILGKSWACSDFVARNCIRYPEMIYRLNAEGFESARSIELYREFVSHAVTTASDEDALMWSNGK